MVDPPGRLVRVRSIDAFDEASSLARRQVNIVPTESEKFPHAQSGTKSDQDDSTPVADANGKGCAWEVRRQSSACFDELIGLGEVQKVRDDILKPV